jgi:hypothetical protein
MGRGLVKPADHGCGAGLDVSSVERVGGGGVGSCFCWLIALLSQLRLVTISVGRLRV